MAKSVKTKSMKEGTQITIKKISNGYLESKYPNGFSGDEVIIYHQDNPMIKNMSKEEKEIVRVKNKKM